MIGTGGYLAASGLVALTVLSIGWAAERIRQSVGLDGTLAAGLLAWSLIALGLLTALALVLGAAGVLGRYQLVAGALVIAVLSEFVWRRRGRSRSPSLLGPVTFDRWALAGTALVIAAWLAGVNHSWDVGLTGFDTLSYHLPFAYAFAFEGGLRQYTFVDVSYLHHFYPAGSELLNATGLALVGRDLLVPFLNFGFALVALLAAWVLGSRLGSARVGLLAVVPLMVSGLMVRQQAGVASSDIGAAAMALSAFAAAAIALDRDSRRSGPSATAWLAVAGVAAGLGIGIKLTAVAPLGVLVLWLAWAAWRDKGLRAGFGVFLLALAVIGLPWELRNLILSGNPVPFIKAIGPIELPYPERGFEGRDPFSVAHYLADPSRSVLTDYFLPGLSRTLGWAWPVIILLALFGAIWSLARAGSRGRAIAVAALLGGFLYLMTPFSAAGPEGFPMGFAWNLRYLAPALIIGLCLLAAWGGQQNPRGGLARITPVLLIAVAVVTAVSSDLLDLWKGLDLLWILGAALIAMVTVAILRRPRAPLIPVAVGAVALGIFLVGLFDRSSYLERPTADTPRDFAGDRSLQVAASDLDGQTLGITGHLAALEQYRLRGADFGTEVLYVGVEQSNGGFRAVRSCRELERVIRDEGIDVLAASPDRDFDSPNRLEVFPEVASAEEIGQARFLRRYRTEGLVEYYRVIPGASGCRPAPR